MTICPYCLARPISSGRPIAGKPRRTCGDKACIKKRCKAATDEWKANRSPEKVAADKERLRQWTRDYREDWELYDSPKYKRMKAKSRKKNYHKLKDAGLCVGCYGRAPAVPGRVRCAACQAADTARIKVYRTTDKYFEWVARDAAKERGDEA